MYSEYYVHTQSFRCVYFSNDTRDTQLMVIIIFWAFFTHRTVSGLGGFVLSERPSALNRVLLTILRRTLRRRRRLSTRQLLGTVKVIRPFSWNSIF